MHDDFELTDEQRDRAWTRIEQGIRAGATPVVRRSNVVVLRAAVVLLWVGFAAAFAAYLIGQRSESSPTPRTPVLADLGARAAARPAVARPWPLYLAVRVADGGTARLDEHWIDRDGRGCLLSGPASDREALVPQCGPAMAQVGGLTPTDLTAIARAGDRPAAMASRLRAVDPRASAGTRAEYVIGLLAWDGVDPTVRAAGFELLDDAGYRVVAADRDRITVEGPGDRGPVTVVFDARTTRTQAYGPAGSPPDHRYQAATGRPLPTP